MINSTKSKSTTAKTISLGGITDEQLGHRLQTIRKSKGLTQKDIIKLSGLDLTQQLFSKYESGGVRISAITLHVLAEVMKVDIKDFFPRKNADKKSGVNYFDTMLNQSILSFHAISEQCLKEVDRLKKATR